MGNGLKSTISVLATVLTAALPVFGIALAQSHAKSEAELRFAPAIPAAAILLPVPRPERLQSLVGAVVFTIPEPVRNPVRANAPELRPNILSSRDFDFYRRAFAEARLGRHAAARRLANQAGDVLPAKVIDWLWLRSRGSGAGFDRIAAFLEQNPIWPGRVTLRRRAEDALDGRTPDQRVLDWFATQLPTTGWGMMRLAEARLATGDAAGAKEMLRHAWVFGDFTRARERRFYARHRGMLEASDHVARLDRVLWDRRRGAAHRMLGRVDDDSRRLGKARLSLIGFTAGVDWAVGNVPAFLVNDPGLIYDRARWRRVKGKHAGAREMLAQRPNPLPYPKRWWIERRIQIRKLLANDESRAAYAMAADHGLIRGRRFAEAEFLAGWIALRHLNDAETGFKHFQTLHANVKFPVSRARAAYWAGRAADRLAQPALAATWFERAAAYSTTYYGQLAGLKLAGPAKPLPAPPLKPTPAAIAAYEKTESAQIVRRLAELGQTKLLKSFFIHMADVAKSGTQRRLVLDMIAELAPPSLMITVAKRVSRDGTILVHHSYPESAVLSRASGPVEAALVHAVARQESVFNPRAVSHAGARGLMQLMPATARLTARQMGLHYSRDRLIDDPDYNARLGVHYLARLIERYDGSYLMALAAYNAGEARVDRWVRIWGDPRATGIDPIDWAESIPFTETRNYVQRVLENLQAYRRLLKPAHQDGQRLAGDLTGRRVNGSAAAGCTASSPMTPTKIGLTC